jgi:gamma-glutamyl-gamma-aminobutyrate hydrolase PuuD
MNKKTIGIYADSISGEMKQTAPYINFILNFGIPRLITQYDDPDEIAEQCDMLLIPGGADINPMRYNEIPHHSTGRCNVQYEYLDSVMIPAFIMADKPIVGICRGFQTLNAYFGGTLFQDVKGHNQTKGYGARSETKDDLWTENGIFKINTIHHQSAKKLGDNLEAIGFSPVISGCPSLLEPEFLTTKTYANFNKFVSFTEAFKHKSLPIVAFQYHPEEFNCEFAINEINKILK